MGEWYKANDGDKPDRIPVEPEDPSAHSQTHIIPTNAFILLLFELIQPDWPLWWLIAWE